MHWVGVAIRESVINAIKHGNQQRPGQDACSSSSRCRSTGAPGSMIRVRGPGRGLRPRGRRRPAGAREPPESRAGAASSSFAASWTTSSCSASPQGGMEVRMVKRVQPAATPDDPVKTSGPASVLSTTAIEAVVRAGDMQMARFGRDLRVDKKGASTSSPRSIWPIERSSARSSPRDFPITWSSARKWAAPRAARAARAGSSIPSTARPTSRTACRSSARRWRSRSTASRRSRPIYDPTRRELFTAERGGGAFLNGAPMRVSRTRRCSSTPCS